MLIFASRPFCHPRVAAALLPGLLAGWLAGCTPSRSYYTGPGSVATTLPYQARPTWLGRDTAATYVSAYGGPALRYNEFDQNLTFGGQLHRAWAWQSLNAAAGAFGNAGRYTFAQSYAPQRLARLGYGVAGVELGFSLFPADEYAPRARTGVEWRILNLHFSLAREWGAVARWRAHPTDPQGQPLLFTTNLSDSPWLTTFSFGTELVTRAPRPNSPQLTIGGGYQVRLNDGSLYGTLAVGAGRVLLTGQVIGPGQLAFSKPTYQFGLTYALTRQ